MSAVPTIVAGLFIYSMLILTLGKMNLPPRVETVVNTLGLGKRSGFAASIALSVSMIPVVVTTAEVVLRLVPGGLREASLALGTTKWQTVRRVVLPTARSGLVTAVLLGVARVIGETSPVLLVAGSTSELNYDALHGPQVSLPLFVFNQMRLPLDEAIARAFGAAVVLLALVVVLFGLARVIGGRPAWPRQSAPAAPDGHHRRARTGSQTRSMSAASKETTSEASPRPQRSRCPRRLVGLPRAGPVPAPGAGGRLRVRSPEPARPGARSPSTPGGPTCAPPVSW